MITTALKTRRVYVALSLMVGTAVGTFMAQGAEQAVTLKDLMAVTITDTTNVLWNAALLEPPAGAAKPVPTDGQWQEFDSNAKALAAAVERLASTDLPIAQSGTPAAEGSLAPDAIAKLRSEKPAVWQAQVKVLQEGANAAARATAAKDFDALLAAGDAMYPVCESCHQQFWYPGQGQQ